MPKNSPLMTSLATLDRDMLQLYIQQLGTSVEKLENEQKLLTQQIESLKMYLGEMEGMLVNLGEVALTLENIPTPIQMN